MRWLIEAGAGSVRVVLDGEIDLALVDDVNAAIATAISQASVGIVTVDLDAVTFLDSTGIGCLIRGWHLAEEAGIDYRVTNPHGQVLQVLDISGVWSLVGDHIMQAAE